MSLVDTSPLLVLTVMAVAGAAMGALWIGLTGFLRARLGVNETIASLVLAYIGMAVFNHLVEGVFRDPASLSKPSTFGIGDAKAVAESRARIMAARNAGTAVLLISEDLDEILELADRIVVMHGGKVVHEMPAAGADPQEFGRHMLGHGEARVSCAARSLNTIRGDWAWRVGY